MILLFILLQLNPTDSFSAWAKPIKKDQRQQRRDRMKNIWYAIKPKGIKISVQIIK